MDKTYCVVIGMKFKAKDNNEASIVADVLSCASTIFPITGSIVHVEKEIVSCKEIKKEK